MIFFLYLRSHGVLGESMQLVNLVFHISISLSFNINHVWYISKEWISYINCVIMPRNLSCFWITIYKYVSIQCPSSNMFSQCCENWWITSLFNTKHEKECPKQTTISLVILLTDYKVVFKTQLCFWIFLSCTDISKTKWYPTVVF